MPKGNAAMSDTWAGIFNGHIINIMDSIKWYKWFKRLKELRLERRKIDTELDILYNLTYSFDMKVMPEVCCDNLEAVEDYVCGPRSRHEDDEAPEEMTTQEAEAEPEEKTLDDIAGWQIMHHPGGEKDGTIFVLAQTR